MQQRISVALTMFKNILSRSKWKSFFVLLCFGYFLRVVLPCDVIYLLNRSLVLWISYYIAEVLYCKHSHAERLFPFCLSNGLIIESLSPFSTWNWKNQISRWR